METASDTADCGSCTVPHPRRLHAEGGACEVALCGCRRFEAATPVRAARCTVCGGLAHATGRCPFPRRAT